MKHKLHGFIMPFLFFVISYSANSQNNISVNSTEKLTHEMTPAETLKKGLIGIDAAVTDPPPGNVSSIAEFERSYGSIVRYPLGIPISIVREIAKDNKLITLVESAAEETAARAQYTEGRVNLQNCEFVRASTDSYWTRDYSPFFITYGDNKIGMVDFTYNRPRPQDDEVPSVLATDMGVEIFGMPLIHTGGNYMTDGYGYAASSTIAHYENDSILTFDEIDQIMEDYLGITDYSVMNDPNNDYIKHIDCWAKYLSPNKVLVRSVPQSHPQYDEIEEAATYFANKTSVYGSKYIVYRVYTPNNEPYTNSYILNNKVFVPLLDSENDDEAIQVYEEAMPGYEIHGFYGLNTDPWIPTDALHCRVHEVADFGMLRIKHLPLIGTVRENSNYNFSAEIKAYSGQSLVTDSVLLFYRVNASTATPFKNVKMTRGSNDIWNATLGSLETGSKIEYFIYAVDASGRRESHPFVGSADPHVFNIGQRGNADIALSSTDLNLIAMKDNQETIPLQINNKGSVGLSYVLSLSTTVDDTISISIPNSPAANNYNSNTLQEDSWHTFSVHQQGTVENIVVNYQWDADDFYTEGSLWLESPTGKKVNVATGQKDGYYKMIVTDLAGESLNGNWKIWIQDSNGDGGSIATRVVVKLVKANPAGSWLSTNSISGEIAVGTSTEINITGNAQGLELGEYHGKLTLYSNDPDQAVIQIPVKFTVSVNTGIGDEKNKRDIVDVNPNPFGSTLYLKINSPESTRMTVEMFDSQGNHVKNEYMSVTTGIQNMAISTSDMPQGLYMLRVTIGDYEETIKLIKN